MKKLLLFFTFLFTFNYFQAQFPEKSNLQKENLKGTIKSVLSNYFDAEEKFGEVVKKELKRTYLKEFNKQGNYTDYQLKDNTDKLGSFISKYQYKNGVLIEETYKKPKQVPNNYELTERLFNKLGQLQEENYYTDKGDLYSKKKYQWSSFFNMSGYTFYNSSGKLVYKISYFYEDTSIKKAQKTLIDKIKSWTNIDLTSTFIVESKVDKNDNLTQLRYLDSNGNELVLGELISGGKSLQLESYNYIINQFNENGDLIVYYKINFEKNGEQVIIKYSPIYDANGNILETQKFINGKKTSKSENEFSYTYDKNNNWIKRINRDNTYGVTTFYIVEREIKYY
tara:strand:- start:1544 stop:2560 length:1017 start_codon:yes stop_codon:yes gene_type:complete